LARRTTSEGFDAACRPDTGFQVSANLLSSSTVTRSFGADNPSRCSGVSVRMLSRPGKECAILNRPRARDPCYF